jgi:hypothetical protein
MLEKILEGKQEKNLDTSQTRKPYTEPKLTFIEPKLTKYGDATKVTATDGNGFFGPFSPGSSTTD